MGYKEKDMSKVRNPVAYVAKESQAMTTRRFIHIICNDPALDFMISRLCNLFAVDMPQLQGQWAQHRYTDHH